MDVHALWTHLLEPQGTISSRFRGIIGHMKAQNVHTEEQTRAFRGRRILRGWRTYLPAARTMSAAAGAARAGLPGAGVDALLAGRACADGDGRSPRTCCARSPSSARAERRRRAERPAARAARARRRVLRAPSAAARALPDVVTDLLASGFCAARLRTRCGGGAQLRRAHQG